MYQTFLTACVSDDNCKTIKFVKYSLTGLNQEGLATPVEDILKY